MDPMTAMMMFRGPGRRRRPVMVPPPQVMFSGIPATPMMPPMPSPMIQPIICPMVINTPPPLPWMWSPQGGLPATSPYGRNYDDPRMTGPLGSRSRRSYDSYWADDYDDWYDPRDLRDVDLGYLHGFNRLGRGRGGRGSGWLDEIDDMPMRQRGRDSRWHDKIDDMPARRRRDWDRDNDDLF